MTLNAEYWKGGNVESTNTTANHLFARVAGLLEHHGLHMLPRAIGIVLDLLGIISKVKNRLLHVHQKRLFHANISSSIFVFRSSLDQNRLLMAQVQLAASDCDLLDNQTAHHRRCNCYLSVFRVQGKKVIDESYASTTKWLEIRGKILL